MHDNEEVNKKELNEVIGLSKKILKLLYIVFIVCLILGVILALKFSKSIGFITDLMRVVSPFFVGFALAWLLRPLVLKLNKKIHNNTISSILLFAGLFLILGIILYTFIPIVYNEVNEMVGLLPTFVERITNRVNDLFTEFMEQGLDLSTFKNKILDTITSYSGEIAKDLPNTLINIIASLFSGVGTFLMSAIIGLYILIDYESIGNHFKKIFPKRIQDDLSKLTKRISTEVRKCVNGTFLVALMVLVCDSIGFALVGLNAPILFGLLCGITDLIPFIGPYIGGAAAVIVGLTQDPLIAIGVLIICVIVQILENYVLQPIVMSKASSVHPVLIIIALLVFGKFFGIVGMILATPCLTLLRVIIEFTHEKIEERKKLSN